MRVLSLFDGISCARVSLDRANIPVSSYHSCEIDKNAIKVSQKNYPDIVQCGSIVGYHHHEKPNLLIGGSPCTDLSIAKKDREGLEGSRSSLFWEYVRIKNETNPDFFILENVASMPKKDRDIITTALGVEPVLFNASLVSAQSRKRLFWTNIRFDLPDDKGIVLKDILQPPADVDDRFTVNGKSFCLTSAYSKVATTEAGINYSAARKQRTLVKLGHIGTTDAQANRVYDPSGKSVTLSANGGGLGAKTGLIRLGREVELSTYHKKNLVDPDDKARCLTASMHKGAENNGTTLVRVGREIGRKLEDGVRNDNANVPYQRCLELREDDKTGTLTSVQKDNLVVSDIIRRLTPIECERLQGLPDNYTDSIAKTNRYKALGNAFNVDVVAHILEKMEWRKIVSPSTNEP